MCEDVECIVLEQRFPLDAIINLCALLKFGNTARRSYQSICLLELDKQFVNK
jgi:hypothetical protein